MHTDSIVILDMSQAYIGLVARDIYSLHVP